MRIAEIMRVVFQHDNLSCLANTYAFKTNIVLHPSKEEYRENGKYRSY
jgi:hypothetical protein